MGEIIKYMLHKRGFFSKRLSSLLIAWVFALFLMFYNPQAIKLNLLLFLVITLLFVFAVCVRYGDMKADEEYERKKQEELSKKGATETKVVNLKEDKKDETNDSSGE